MRTALESSEIEEHLLELSSLPGVVGMAGEPGHPLTIKGLDKAFEATT